jgi:hypothetical protein
VKRILFLCTAVVAAAITYAPPSAAESGADAGCEEDAGAPAAEVARERAPEAALGSEPEAEAVAAPIAAEAPRLRLADVVRALTVGATMGMGVAHAFFQDGAYDARPRFAGSGGVYVDYRATKSLAVGVGLELVGKGCILKLDDDYRFRVVYLEIPLGATLSLSRFRIGAAIALDVAVHKRMSLVGGGGPGELRWESRTWGGFERFNLSPRVTFGYAVPVGRATLVPGITGSMEVLKSALDGEAFHNLDVLLTLGVELDLGELLPPAPRPEAPPPKRAEPTERAVKAAPAKSAPKNVPDATEPPEPPPPPPPPPPGPEPPAPLRIRADIYN